MAFLDQEFLCCQDSSYCCQKVKYDLSQAYAGSKWTKVLTFYNTVLLLPKLFLGILLSYVQEMIPVIVNNILTVAVCIMEKY